MNNGIQLIFADEQNAFPQHYFMSAIPTIIFYRRNAIV
jgi:hypothetical protein